MFGLNVVYRVEWLRSLLDSFLICFCGLEGAQTFNNIPIILIILINQKKKNGDTINHWQQERSITRDMCFPGTETHFTWDKCILGRGTLFTRHMCFLGREPHFTSDMCFLGRETHFTRDMCFLGRGTHIARNIFIWGCVSRIGEHI